MQIIWETFAHLDSILIWAIVATGVMTTLLEGSRALGLSRMSLPYLFGTAITGDRSRAQVYGFVLYTLGGLLFAYGYALVFASLQMATWWLGLLLGAAHAIFLLVVFLPLLPAVHPRMATEYDNPQAESLLEPPGWLGLNYGRRTPETTFLGQLVYGLILGAFYPFGG